MMGDRIYVLSGNYREYVVMLGHIPGYRYISSIENIRGIRRGRYVKIGTWYEKPDIEYILYELMLANMVDVTDDIEISSGITYNKRKNTLNTEDDEYLYRIGYKVL